MERFPDSSSIIHNTNRVASSSGLRNLNMLTAKDKTKHKSQVLQYPITYEEVIDVREREKIIKQHLINNGERDTKRIKQER